MGSYNAVDDIRQHKSITTKANYNTLYSSTQTISNQSYQNGLVIYQLVSECFTLITNSIPIATQSGHSETKCGHASDRCIEKLLYCHYRVVFLVRYIHKCNIRYIQFASINKISLLLDSIIQSLLYKLAPSIHMSTTTKPLKTIVRQPTDHNAHNKPRDVNQ